MKVAVALSGGVDSTAVVLELKRAGHDVFGITMQICPDLSALPVRRPERLRAAPAGHGCAHCIAPCACTDAAAVAREGGIRHELVDLRAEFEERVIGPFVDDFARGLTPNPCAACNRWLKFGRLAAVARDLGAEAYATGHYARREADGGLGAVLRAADAQHDQTYFLSLVRAEQFDGVWFPLGGTTKPVAQARVTASGWHARPAVTSSEICFVKDLDHEDFLRARRPAAFIPGEIVDGSGRVLGQHRGLPAYTIGQRRGLGVSAREPLYVIRLEAETNRVVVGPDAALWRTRAVVGPINWLVPAPVSGPVRAQVRYRQTPVPARIDPAPDGGAIVSFAQPVRAVTPGQIAAFYDDRRLLGGALIAPEP